MRKILEFTMDAEEYGTVTNIVSSKRSSISNMADKLTKEGKEEISKWEMIDFLYGIASELEMAENILRDID